MTNEQLYEIKQKKAIEQFNDIIKPILKENNIDIINIEDTSFCESQKWIDHGIGVDALVKETIDGVDCIYMVSLRIQLSNNNWNTFTIRYKRDNGVKTEYEKILIRKEHNAAYPHLHIQCYINSTNGVVTIGISKLDDIIDEIKNNRCRFNHVDDNGRDGATFAFIPFKQIDCKIINEVI